MKYVLVTGAYGGMGKAVTPMLVENGFAVFALDKSVEQPANNVIPIEADLTSVESISSAYDKISTYTTELYAIVHLAGIYMLDSLVEISSEKYKKIFDVNVHGAFNVNRIFLPMLKTGSKLLLVTSELAPLDPLPFTGIYAITKSTLDKYAYSLRMELQLLGISVSVLRSGAVNTSMLGVSTTALDSFCKNTKLYSCNAKRFKRIVDAVEARSVSPEKLAKKISKILNKRSPRFAYKLNRNPLLLLLDVLPKELRFKIIKLILK
ncbi:MAG: SDR family NAD(P)-dependent oxidoreductase [Clostridia bacterium]|nr:SDR family NAD(P)-dependent oxidoreductase [Clostridia bacterium]